MFSKQPISFWGIGAQKAGTTWLYARLNELPNFKMTPIKELHYFDRDTKYLSPNCLAETSLIRRISSIGWIIRTCKDLIKIITSNEFRNFKWYYKWYFMTYNDNWYLGLFNSTDKFQGEITPSYSFLDKEDINRMYNLSSNAKIIFLLRNPIERAWSQYRFGTRLDPNYNPQNTAIKHIIDFIDSKGQELRSDYLQTIQNYSECFPKNQILIGFFDAINDNPRQLIWEIVDFIGGDSKLIDKYCQLYKKNNISRIIDIPSEIEDYLKSKYFSLVKELSDKFGGYCSKWYSELYSINNSNNNLTYSPTIKVG